MNGRNVMALRWQVCEKMKQDRPFHGISAMNFSGRRGMHYSIVAPWRGLSNTVAYTTYGDKVWQDILYTMIYMLKVMYRSPIIEMMENIVLHII